MATARRTRPVLKDTHKRATARAGTSQIVRGSLLRIFWPSDLTASRMSLNEAIRFGQNPSRGMVPGAGA